MTIPCPTCKRLGKVSKAFPAGTAMSYCGPDGERWPHETCQTCMGSGWVNDDRPIQTDAEKQISEYL
jgi:hypothetical protein